MIRIVFQELALFLVPFALFALVLVLTRRRVLAIESWSQSAAWLALAGLLLVVGGFVLMGVFGETHTGGYVPPHMEDGKPVPGGFR
ncbi:DUF6111 family protein [Enterovirga sp.]|jgi:hypothetical protein|uniref:DUF6111 family protein n=1 Tax=Enterovirga sp. TaxID=2026350 RepID=UPI00262DB075|nr:DUF6111 family protein [Enterovirga sp.]MDB5592206.1 hypothetical protein [Enterovirga sp.]